MSRRSLEPVPTSSQWIGSVVLYRCVAEPLVPARWHARRLALKVSGGGRDRVGGSFGRRL